MPQEGETKTWLETTHGDRILLHGICSIGRAESNNVIVNKGAVSRHHAIVHERDKAYWVVDLGGVNGLLLNGERVVQTAKLKSGDVIGIPTTDFIFLQETVSAETPVSSEPKPNPPLETPAPKEPKANPPLEGPMAATHKPEPIPPVSEITTPTAVTIPLPEPRKPTQQDELPLGLPPQIESVTETGKLRKPRVYVGPVDTQGLPKVTSSQPLRPEAFKLSDTGAAKPFSTTSLPKSIGDELLKITTPLSPVPWIEKPKEIRQVNASDVVVPVEEKSKTPPPLPEATEAKAKADSFLQPSISQEAASSTKSGTLLQKPKEAIPLSSIPAIVPEGAKAPPPLAKADRVEKSDAPNEESFILAPPSVKEPTKSATVPPLLLMDRPAEVKKSSPVEEVPVSLPAKSPPPLAATPAFAKSVIEDIILGPPASPAITPDDATQSSPIQKAPDVVNAPAATKLKDPKKAIPKASVPAPKVQATATPKVVPPADSPIAGVYIPQGALCPAALHSMYIGLASIFLPFLGLITAPIAIFLGHSALKEIKLARGALTGRPSAILGLYFGYISLVVIATYSIILFILFVVPGQTHSAIKPVSVVLSPTTFTMTNSLPMKVEPAPQPAPVSTPSAPAVTTDTSSQPPAADVTKNAQPQPTPGPQTVVSESTDGNASTLLQSNSTPTPDTNAAPSTPSAAPAFSVPPPSAQPVAVYDPAILSRLKDGMLEQPMPQDSTSPAYQDAEAFNNCARLLARPPDPKYAESVGDFLDDVKKRNPDPARLQILSAMYENYMAGIKRDN